MSRRTRSRDRQRGSAMLVTMIIIAALLAGGAVLVSLQLASNRSTDLTRSGMSALYCAEAGLSAARPAVAQNYAQWKATLATAISSPPTATDPPTEPAWLYTAIGNHDLDGITGDDFVVYIKDNGDDGTAADDPTTDKDLQIFIVARCISARTSDTQKEVSELVLYNGAAPCMGDQIGGEDGNGNKNDGC